MTFIPEFYGNISIKYIFDNIYLCRGEGIEAWINMINGSRCNRTKYQVFQYCYDK